MNIDKSREAANITEYHIHIISKLIFHRIKIPKFINIRLLFHVYKNVKNQHV